jgi:hypothetical protein
VVTSEEATALVLLFVEAVALVEPVAVVEPVSVLA